MQCPYCSDKLLDAKINYNSVNVCKNCNGFWINPDLVPSVLDYYSGLREQGKKIVTSGDFENSMLNNLIGSFCPECNLALNKEKFEFANVVS